ncbi:MAG: DUF4403 family protein [Chitinophagaceae bacterium]
MVKNCSPLFIISSFVIISFISACSSSKQIAALKPVESYTKEVIYDKKVSYFSLPIEITVADLQNQVNKYMQGLLYDDNSFTDDNVMLKVWKQSPIIISEKAGKLELELPLKIWANIRYGFEKLGIAAYDNREFNLNGRVKLQTNVQFKNWRFATNTQITGFEWVESPSIVIAGKNIPITYFVNPAIILFKNKIAKSIDENIAKSLDVKPYIYQTLDQISKPVLVNETYKVWFAMQPVELYTNEPQIANKKIALALGMKSFLETAVNSKPNISFDKNKLLLSGVEKLPEQFQLSIASIVSYTNAAQLMQTNFAGKKFESGGKSITVQQINIWGKDDRMIVALNVTGSVNGTFYLSGLPAYDAAKKEVFLKEVDFVVDSKNKLLKLANWLAHGTIVKKLEESCRYSIAEQLAEGEKNVKQYLTNYQPVTGVFVNGQLQTLVPQRILLTPNAIVTSIDATGTVAIKIQGMK